MTSSHAGVCGNFGQAWYSAAKAALLGITKTLAVEGIKYNIRVNAILPLATGTEKGLDYYKNVLGVSKEATDRLSPDFVTPVLVWLCHESCQENGGVWLSGAGWTGQLQWLRGNGAVLGSSGEVPEPEEARDKWNQIKDMTDCKYFPSSEKLVFNMMENVTIAAKQKKPILGKI